MTVFANFSVEMGDAGTHVALTVETTDALSPDAVALVMADMAQLAQTVRRHSAPAPRRPSAPAPAYTRLREAFDGKQS